MNTNAILEKHRKWLRGEDGGERANLSRAYLYGADLSGANLSGTNLSGTNLSRTNLSGADLSGANLSGTNLSGTNLYGTYLSGADLSGANLSRTNLYGADLSGTNLYGADLSGANLSRAYLYGAKVEESIKIKFFPLACPETGAFIGYKKAAQNFVVKLQIPEDAKRSSAYGRKCRCDKALVLGIYDTNGNETGIKQVTSKRNEDFVYEVGQTVSVPDFDEDRWNECSTGIHFFITFAEAANYI